jgi:AGCS family alanine or glycine:cation symporter
VVALCPLVVKITKNYVDRRIKKKDVKPVLSYDPEIEEAVSHSLDEE